MVLKALLFISFGFKIYNRMKVIVVSKNYNCLYEDVVRTEKECLEDFIHLIFFYIDFEVSYIEVIVVCVVFGGIRM